VAIRCAEGPYVRYSSGLALMRSSHRPARLRIPSVGHGAGVGAFSPAASNSATVTPSSRSVLTSIHHASSRQANGSSARTRHHHLSAKECAGSGDVFGWNKGDTPMRGRAQRTIRPILLCHRPDARCVHAGAASSAVGAAPRRRVFACR
jgi:hypothetical protein